MLLYTLTVAWSAFLLFEVQPIVAKMILPWFGGSSAVWSTCMLFFQMALLLGYLYAHWLHQKLRGRVQAIVHIGALAVSCALLPILPNPSWKTAGGAPSLTILALLAATVGLPYFLLASTSPLLQAWYARTHKAGLPYRLFALSNFASMLALLSYPLLVEPNLPTRIQGYAWSAGYICFAVLCAVTAWRACNHPAPALAPIAAPVAEGAASSPWNRLLWLGLSASASVLLLAVTNHLTQDIAAIPFLWIAPLSAYLLSFILCFEAPRLYHRAVFLPLTAAALGFMTYQMWPEHRVMEMRSAIEVLVVSLFVCCMACHGELARLKPPPQGLTGFYVMVSLGGAMGGLFVGLAAPNFFRAYYEFPLGLGIAAAVLAAVNARDLWRSPCHLSWRLPAPPRYAAAALIVAMLGGYGWCLFHIMQSMATGYHLVTRNFYGQLRVFDTGNPEFEDGAARALVHGAIDHGEQFLRAKYRRRPVTYFCPESGIGRGMGALTGSGRSLGVIGLGCGTLAAYGKPGDTLRIYEINPLVLHIARSEFTYLQDTPAKVEVALGDARLSLEAEPSRQFDLLAVDAFSSDAVPVHLLTLEAFRVYFRHLKPDGILAVNITNHYLDLKPVMERAASAFGKVALYYDYEVDPNEVFCFACDWMLIMSPSALAAHAELKYGGQIMQPQPAFRAWTDDFSNLYSILR
ncbi:MAG: fused MFS/spermidine synthase [Bryobacteraceae bacterium]|jgi:SAM-dependent methyltransferase